MQDADLKMIPDAPDAPQTDAVRETVSKTPDLGRQLLYQCHDVFDEFHLGLTRIHFRERPQDLGAVPPLLAFSTCEKWDQLRPSVLKVISLIQVISVMLPVLAKVVLVLNTLSGLLDSVCSVPQPAQQEQPQAETTVTSTETPTLGKPLTY